MCGTTNIDYFYRARRQTERVKESLRSLERASERAHGIPKSSGCGLTPEHHALRVAQDEVAEAYRVLGVHLTQSILRTK